MSLLECSQLECGTLCFERKTGLQQAPGAGTARVVPSVSSGLTLQQCSFSLSVAQAELAVILKFVLDHEDGLNLNEDLENFLQKGK